MVEELEKSDSDKATVQQVELHNEAALALVLASERVSAARMMLELRETQLQFALNSIKAEYSENGKFRVVELNVDKRTVGRVKVGEE